MSNSPEPKAGLEIGIGAMTNEPRLSRFLFLSSSGTLCLLPALVSSSLARSSDWPKAAELPVRIDIAERKIRSADFNNPVGVNRDSIRMLPGKFVDRVCDIHFNVTLSIRSAGRGLRWRQAHA